MENVIIEIKGGLVQSVRLPNGFEVEATIIDRDVLDADGNPSVSTIQEYDKGGNVDFKGIEEIHEEYLPDICNVEIMADGDVCYYDITNVTANHVTLENQIDEYDEIEVRWVDGVLLLDNGTILNSDDVYSDIQNAIDNTVIDEEKTRKRISDF